MADLQNFYNREDSRWLEVVAYTCCLNVHAVPTIGRISKFFRCFFSFGNTRWESGKIAEYI